MIVSLPLNMFFSRGDEDRFFQTLTRSAAVRAVRGVGLDLAINLDPRRLDRDSLLDLIALLHRYGISSRPFGKLAERRSFGWLRDRTKYWYRSMFVDTAAVSRSGETAEMLYTVMMEYRGGTYVSQVYARDIVGALRAWVVALDVKTIAGLGPRRKAELIADIKEQLSRRQEPAQLDGLVNTWCASAITSGGLALINVVAISQR